MSTPKPHLELGSNASQHANHSSDTGEEKHLSTVEEAVLGPHDPPHFHDEPAPRAVQQYRTLLLSFVIITGFMLVEAIGGWLTHSLALLSDAGHMLSDAAALGATLLAFKIGEKAATEHKTFGYKRFEILVAGANGATLIIIAIMIFIEAIGRISSPPDVATKGMLIIATLGLLVNLVVAWLLHRGNAHHDHDAHNHDAQNHGTTPAEQNLNMHSAYLHVLGDLMGSVAAIIAALAMMWFGWWWADSAASVIVAALILFSGYRVVKQSVHILMEGTPNDISLEQVVTVMESHPAVIKVHDLHVWTITSGLHALSCHVVVDGEMSISEASTLIHDLEGRLKALGISHATIQVESSECPNHHGDALVC
ncbi:MAG: cation diffusion facilitator family transporter, partial [Psychrobacter sp.]|nr:cation diffusion facilitator family transporter [Psychrobacter sp.]